VRAAQLGQEGSRGRTATTSWAARGEALDAAQTLKLLFTGGEHEAFAAQVTAHLAILTG